MSKQKTKTLMLMGAHHDDNELMAGLITKHVKNGWHVISVVITDGKCIAGRADEVHIAIREAESIAAAKLLDMDALFLRFPEGGLRANETLCIALTRLIRERQPDIMVTHPPMDYHSDHESVSNATRDAVMRCWNPTYDEATEPSRVVPTLYYCDSWFQPFQPDVYVDVTDDMDIKAAALAAHKSQLPPDPKDPSNMIEQERARARYRGIQANTGYAEGYQRVTLAGLRHVADLLVK